MFDKLIVLDDDPTGVQTVNGINVYTDWTEEAIADGFAAPDRMFFVLTNSRAFSAERTRVEHRRIAERIIAAARRFDKKFIVISRSDSTLRGHYPIETETLRETFELNGYAVDGEILMPFFKEGGRLTMGDVHYVREGERLIPAADTEFARDKTFSYRHSDLKEYVEEKTGGRYKAADVVSVSLEELRAGDVEGIAAKLERVIDFNKVIVNATDYEDVETFVQALSKAMSSGKNFLFRTAAAFPKVIGGVKDRPLLTASELLTAGNANGGLIIVGSHVRKTTQQLEAL
ncbi:MAG: hydroxyacid dehydrogenase, partial [Selenomonadaceae bacterium]|nr:hydroxyacid dehydrogenase [Selenomonadaceae bacterium]